MIQFHEDYADAEDDAKALARFAGAPRMIYRETTGIGRYFTLPLADGVPADFQIPYRPTCQVDADGTIHNA